MINFSVAFKMNQSRCDIVKIFLLDDEEEEDFFLKLMGLMPNKRRSIHPMILNRDSEGAFAILVKKYLMTDEDKFVKFFRVDAKLFYTILENIQNDITTPSSNRNPNPISAEQKLCITLR